jgi:hypothetical protein
MNQNLHDETGTSLLEALVALCVLVVGLLGLAQVFGLGMAHASTASSAMVAREKAREAVESVHTARDTRTVTWAQIRNAADGGIFADGQTPLRMPGPDGMVNTGDDCTTVALPACPTVLQSTLLPGANGQLGDLDDVWQPLSGFTREVIIEDVAGSPALRRLTVIIRYRVGRLTPPPFTLVTFVSSFS